MDEMTIDHIRRLREAQKPADLPTVIERVHRDCPEKRGQASLPGTIPPYLGHYRMGRMQPSNRASGGGEEGSCGFVAAVYRDQHPGIKDHSP